MIKERIVRALNDCEAIAKVPDTSGVEVVIIIAREKLRDPRRSGGKVEGTIEATKTSHEENRSFSMSSGDRERARGGSCSPFAFSMSA